MAIIDLFVCLYNESYRYAEFTKDISSILLSNKHKINWKCVSCGKPKKIPRGYEYVGSASGGKSPSMRHGITLNKASKLATEKYVIMLDTDLVILCKDWDDVIIKNLDKDCAAFGAGSPSQIRRAQNFPFAYFFCYRRDLLKELKLDFRPRDSKSGNQIRGIVKTCREKDVLGLPFGSKFRWETSSRIPFLFYDNNLKSKSLGCVLGDSSKVKLPFLDKKSKKEYLKMLNKSKLAREYMEEWHYKDNLFATHLRGSILYSFDDEYVQHWIKRINLYLKSQYRIIM